MFARTQFDEVLRKFFEFRFLLLRKMRLGVEFLNMANYCWKIRTRMRKLTHWREPIFIACNNHNWHFGQCVNPMITSTARHKQPANFRVNAKVLRRPFRHLCEHQLFSFALNDSNDALTAADLYLRRARVHLIIFLNCWTVPITKK